MQNKAAKLALTVSDLVPCEQNEGERFHGQSHSDEESRLGPVKEGSHSSDQDQKEPEAEERNNAHAHDLLIYDRRESGRKSYS